MQGKVVDANAVNMVYVSRAFYNQLQKDGVDGVVKLDDYEYQWWYSDNGSDKKISIEGATSSEYKIEAGMVGKYIGIDVFENGKDEVLIERVANK